jgi:hypothetical protein
VVTPRGGHWCAPEQTKNDTGYQCSAGGRVHPWAGGSGGSEWVGGKRGGDAPPPAQVFGGCCFDTIILLKLKHLFYYFYSYIRFFECVSGV